MEVGLDFMSSLQVPTSGLVDLVEQLVEAAGPLQAVGEVGPEELHQALGSDPQFPKIGTARTHTNLSSFGCHKSYGTNFRHTPIAVMECTHQRCGDV